MDTTVMPAIDGVRYGALVPDTLDLAERGRMAINALTGAADENARYEGCHCANMMVHPAYMSHVGDQDCEPKVLEALPIMRMMSGSEQNLHVQAGMLDRILRDVEDGLWWMKPEGRPWELRPLKEDTADVMGQSRLMLAIMSLHQTDGNPRWLELLHEMAGALERLAIVNGDHAYYPGQRYHRDGWRSTSGHNPDAAEFYGYPQGNALRALSCWYALSGDTGALALADKLAKPLLWPQRWTPINEPWMIAGADHGHWSGHFHSTTVVGWGLLEYAIARNDARVKRFVGDFYEYSRNLGVARIGYFPGVVSTKETMLRPDTWQKQHPGAPTAVCMEGCSLGEMICIAISLSDAGVGDYWDDVDQYVRNHLVEMQLLRKDLMEEVSEAGAIPTIRPGTQITDNVIGRQVGTFVSCAELTMVYPMWTMCCTGNLSVGLVKAWEAILRYHEGVVQVNLLLNRASPWLDVDSYLPYEGKVVLRNKTARRVHLRLPLWVDKAAVRCQVDGKGLAPTWLGNYLLFDGLQPGQVTTVEFPVAETTEHLTEPTYATQYALRMKGNTLVDISPRAETPSFTRLTQDDGLQIRISKAYPIYQREHYKQDRAPMVDVTRFVPSATRQ